MKIKVSELCGPALDWAVAKCESLFLGDDLFGLKPIIASPVFTQQFKPSTVWAQGGPIIERESMKISPYHNQGGWWAEHAITKQVCDGPTPLIAAMRCYCCAKLGEYVDIPEELCQQSNS